MRGRRRGPIGAITILVAIAALPAAQAEAQEGVPVPEPPAPRAPEAPAPPECICLPERATAPGSYAFFGTRRARLGVMLGDPVTVAGRNGVALEDVPEGSPAHRAGLRAGDVIVAMDGTELGEKADARLIERMGEVEPGDTVPVVFLRDGRERTVRVVPEAASGPRGLAPSLRAMALPGRDMDVRVMRAPRLERLESRLEELGPRLERLEPHFLRPGLMGSGLELAAVNPELGEYFGTERGVLVTDVDSDTPFGLQPGDVILAIGSRDVQDPGHVRAILASYRAGEEIVFRIVRERRTREVTGRRS